MLSEPNLRLQHARLRTPSPSGQGSLSRSELAKLVTAYLRQAKNKQFAFDANYVGKLERGEIRWPQCEYREALRAILGANEDIDLGFFPTKTPVASCSGNVIRLGSGQEHPLVREVMARATATEEADLSSFQQRLLRAYESRLRKNTNSSVLVLIGGYAGSGKTELGQLLADMTGWSLLDKDLLTRPLVEHLLSALNNDPNDRQSETYQRDVRPVEYRCLLNAAFAQLDHGTACILTAPFLQEMPDPTWLRRIINRCGPRGIEVVTVWVDADVDSMYEYLVRRDAARDSWKLNHWDTYIRSLDPDLRPALPHFVVDNSRRTGDSLQQQAGHLAQIVSPL